MSFSNIATNICTEDYYKLKHHKLKVLYNNKLTLLAKDGGIILEIISTIDNYSKAF